MFITFDGKTYNTDDSLQKQALAGAIADCKESWKLQQAIPSLQFQVFGTNGETAKEVLTLLEQQLQKLTGPQVQFSQGFVFRDDRPKCAICTSPLELAQYETGRHWFSDSCYASFICGSCANKDTSNIKTCSKSGCGRLYWAKTAFDTCADCFATQKYQGLATNKAITLPLQLNTPQFHAGTQAETLFRNYVKRVTDLDSITVSSNNGIDLVFITHGDEEYEALKDCIIGTVPEEEPSPTLRRSSRSKTFVFAPQKKRYVIHYCEVKVNDAQCSKAQKDAQAFVEDRLKNALNGQYGEAARQGAQTVEQAMQKGADFEFHLIRVSMPRNGTEEYHRGEAITAVRYPWGETGGLGGEVKVLLEHCNSITYMDSSWIGDTGEEIAKQFLQELGFKVRGAVQNNTGNGVDLAAKLDCTPTSPRWAFFEVKASTVKFQQKLEQAEEEQWMFVMDRCTKALLGIDKYKNLNSTGLQLHSTTWTVSELFWDFQNQEDWAKRALYFQVAVRLPDAGTNDAVQVKLLAWPGPRSQGSKPLKTDPIPQPLFIGYGGTTSSLGNVNVPKVSMQMLSPHPFGGRYDNVHSCFVMGCDCRQFTASFLKPKECSSCGHAHGS